MQPSPEARASLQPLTTARIDNCYFPFRLVVKVKKQRESDPQNRAEKQERMRKEREKNEMEKKRKVHEKALKKVDKERR